MLYDARLKSEFLAEITAETDRDNLRRASCEHELRFRVINFGRHIFETFRVKASILMRCYEVLPCDPKALDLE